MWVFGYGENLGMLETPSQERENKSDDQKKSACPYSKGNWLSLIRKRGKKRKKGGKKSGELGLSGRIDMKERGNREVMFMGAPHIFSRD